jgi:hypothetical protein
MRICWCNAPPLCLSSSGAPSRLPRAGRSNPSYHRRVIAWATSGLPIRSPLWVYTKCWELTLSHEDATVWTWAQATGGVCGRREGVVVGARPRQGAAAEGHGGVRVGGVRHGQGGVRGRPGGRARHRRLRHVAAQVPGSSVCVCACVCVCRVSPLVSIHGGGWCVQTQAHCSCLGLSKQHICVHAFAAPHRFCTSCVIWQ